MSRADESEARHHFTPAVPAKNLLARPAEQLVGEGYYLINGNSVGRVQTSKASGRRYAVSLDAHTGRWTYATGLIFKITEADKLTLQQAMEIRQGHRPLRYLRPDADGGRVHRARDRAGLRGKARCLMPRLVDGICERCGRTFTPSA